MSDSVEPKAGPNGSSASGSSESAKEEGSAASEPLSQAPTVATDEEAQLDFDEVGNADGAEKTADEPAAPPDPLEIAKAESKKLRDQLLRTAADFDNFRKRARRDQEDATRRGRDTILKEMLPVFDNLERAASSADSAPDIKSVGAGLRMVLKQFEQTLERIGIRRVESVGKPFDPALHEAIQHVESAEHEPGVITTEIQPGYASGGGLVRAAMVVVSRGPGPSGDAPAEPDSPHEDAGDGEPPPSGPASTH